MIRGPILWHARQIVVLTLLLATAAVVAPSQTAWSQERATQDRLDRVERDLTMLQRQIYRIGGPGQAVPAGQSAVETELRMDRIETQMRELTGRVEAAVNGIEQLRSRIEQINSDIEVRFNQGPGQARGAPLNSHANAGITDSDPAGPITMRTAATAVNPPPPKPTASLMPPGIQVPPPRDPSSRAGTLTPPGPLPGRQAMNFAPADSVRTPNPSGLPSGSPTEQYNHAYGLLKQADYPAAEEAFKTFVSRHPDDALAGSAQFWLGETFYARGQFAEAAGAFAEGYKRYPKGSKAADDLLKLGMSLARANQKQNACVALAQLDRDFPHPGAAIKERVSAEKKRLGC
jgi:tol-pal system protein YbgF